MGNEERRSKVCSVILIVCIAAAVLSSATAVPITIRALYYAHIGPLELTAKSGMTEEQIRQAFDDVMDYCTGKTDSFSAGLMHWSAEGAAHFADVRRLFILDFWIAGLSFIGIAVMIIYCLAKGRKPYFFVGHGPWFWSALGIGSAMVTAALMAVKDFDRAFKFFHKIFFTGKDIWVLHSDIDPVINILPQEFFRNCAILIFVIIIISCSALVASDYGILYRNRRKLSKNVYQK